MTLDNLQATSTAILKYPSITKQNKNSQYELQRNFIKAKEEVKDIMQVSQPRRERQIKLLYLPFTAGCA